MNKILKLFFISSFFIFSLLVTNSKVSAQSCGFPPTPCPGGQCGPRDAYGNYDPQGNCLLNNTCSCSETCCAGGGGEPPSPERVSLNAYIIDEEGIRYSPNGCPGHGSGAEISVSQGNASLGNWWCTPEGGHVDFTVDRNSNVTVAVTQLPFGFNGCNWQDLQSGVTGPGCSRTFNSGSSDWAKTTKFTLTSIQVPMSGYAYCIRPDNGQPRRVNGMNIQHRSNSSVNTTVGTTSGLGPNNIALGNWNSSRALKFWRYGNLNVVATPAYPNAGNRGQISTACIHSNIFGIDFNFNGNNPGSINEVSNCGDPYSNLYNPARENIAFDQVAYNLGACTSGMGDLGCNEACSTTNDYCSDDDNLGCSASAGNICRLIGNESDTDCNPNPQPNTCGDGNPVSPEQCDDGNHNTADACDTFAEAPNSAGVCKHTFCGDGIVQTPNGSLTDGVTNEQCDDGNTNNNDNCNNLCQRQVLFTGKVNVGTGAQQNSGGYTVCQGITTGSFNPAPSGTVTYRILTNPQTQQTSTINSDGTFSALLKIGASGMPDVSVRLPDSISGSPVNCAPASAGYSVQTVRADYSTTNGALNFYYTDTTTTPIDPWYQTQGGLIYGGGNITDSTMPSGSFFSLRVGSNLRSAAIPWSGGSIMNLGSGLPTQRQPSEQNQKVVGSTPTQPIESYIYFIKKFNLNSAFLIPTVTITEKPPCNNTADGVTLCKTNGDLTVDITSTAWQVQGTEKSLVFVNGNLTIKNSSSLGKIISVQNGSFLGFIVNGTITFEPSVGNTNPADNTPSVEGVFIGKSITVQGLTSGVDKRFVGAGSFIANEGSLTLSRDIGSSNNATPAELFIYRPDFVLNTPEKMLNYTLEYREVN